MRLVRSSCVVLGIFAAIVFLEADKKAAPLWVLTLFRANAPSVVADSYVDRAVAIAAAQRLDDGPDTWVTVSPSQLHAQNRGVIPFSLAFLSPRLFAQGIPQSNTPLDSLVLPVQLRQGTFTSPTYDLVPGATRLAASLQMSLADLDNVNTGVVLYIDRTLDNGNSWIFGCGISFKGPAGRSSDGEIGIPQVSCSFPPASRLRARAGTCHQLAPTDPIACDPQPLAVGATITAFSS